MKLDYIKFLFVIIFWAALFYVCNRLYKIPDEYLISRVFHSLGLHIIILCFVVNNMFFTGDFLFLDEGTVRNWKRRYDEGGIENLLSDHYLGRIALLKSLQVAELSEQLSSRVYPTTRSIVQLVEDLFGIKYTVGGMTSFLHRLGYSFKKWMPLLCFA